MTTRLIRWALLELVIVRWWNNVSIQCSSRDCERLASLQSHCRPVRFWFSCLLPAIAYGSGSDNNLTHAG